MTAAVRGGRGGGCISAADVLSMKHGGQCLWSEDAFTLSCADKICFKKIGTKSLVVF